MRSELWNLASVGALAALTGFATPVNAQLGGRPAQEWAVTLESGRRLEGLEIEAVVRNAAFQRGSSVADIGAGTGIFSVPIATAVGPEGHVYAVEVDEGFLPIIAAKADSSSIPNITPVLGGFDDPQLPVHDLDAAFLHDVLHHIEHRADYLRTLGTYIRRGGRVIIVDYDGTLPGAPHQDEPAMLITPDQTDEWMIRAGFHLDSEVSMFEDKFFKIYEKH